MLKLVEEHGTRYWALIGAKLNGRTGKQVSVDFDPLWRSSQRIHPLLNFNGACVMLRHSVTMRCFPLEMIRLMCLLICLSFLL